jgi:hypothetical protein
MRYPDCGIVDYTSLQKVNKLLALPWTPTLWDHKAIVILNAVKDLDFAPLRMTLIKKG